MTQIQPVSKKMTPGGWPVSAGMRGSTGTPKFLPTASAVACSASASVKYTVVVGTSGNDRFPTSTTLKPAALSWSAVCPAMPSLPEMLNTWTSASFAAGFALVDVDAAGLAELVALEAAEAESSSDFPE